MLLGEERDHLDLMRDRARNINGGSGNSDSFVLLTDAISVWRGNTPVVGHSKQQSAVFSHGSQWETRIIAVEAVCGNIDTIFFYTIDDMQCGGANVMVSAFIHLLPLCWLIAFFCICFP
jgi:hypothetical protein